MMKNNEGFTLVELLVTIIVGTLITAAATALLMSGIRINKRSQELAIQQNTTRMLMEVMGEIAAEEGYQLTPGNPWSITDGKESVVSYQDGAIYLRNTELLTGVAESTAQADGKLVTITIQMEDGKEYSTTVYCRFLGETPPAAASAVGNAYDKGDYRQVLGYALESGEHSREVTEFLRVLASQLDSRGQILLEDGTATGEYFSEWYIGGYEDNPGWDENTPWCACYLSWALAQNEGLWETPRYANVDTWWSDLVSEKSWTPSNPAAGDIVFFDWILDQDRNPQHVGAVLAVEEGWIYTIEGNSANRVALCRYEIEDPCILGYGQLKWK